jgi:hypothetical protein
MNYNLLFDNNLNFYYILIGSGIILSCSLYYLFKINNTENLNNINTETTNNQDIIVLSDKITDAIADSDLESDIASDSQSSFDSESESTIEIDTTELDLFFMPNVDLDVVSIYELKHFEINSLYRKEIEANNITDEKLEEIIGIFSFEDLCTNDINESIILIITNLIL